MEQPPGSIRPARAYPHAQKPKSRHNRPFLADYYLNPDLGQVGDGPSSQDDKFAPITVAGGRTYTTITTGGCALDTAGKAWCWGSDGSGAVGDGPGNQTQFEPVAVTGGRTYTTIDRGLHHTCALDTGGNAWCWGNDAYGAVGDGGTIDDAEDWSDYRFEPVAVAGGRTFTTIAAGYGHTCALDTAGKAWCWGEGSAGQVGDGRGRSNSEPVAVAGGRAYTTITAGWEHTCALDAAGEAWCWGNAISGQVGNGGDEHGPDQWEPVAVVG